MGDALHSVTRQLWALQAGVHRKTRSNLMWPMMDMSCFLKPKNSESPRLLCYGWLSPAAILQISTWVPSPQKGRATSSVSVQFCPFSPTALCSLLHDPSPHLSCVCVVSLPRWWDLCASVSSLLTSASAAPSTVLGASGCLKKYFLDEQCAGCFQRYI